MREPNRARLTSDAALLVRTGKGAPAPTDADDRFDDSRHLRRTLASTDRARRKPAVSSERHRRRVGRSLLARSASRGFGGFTLADCRSGLCRVGVPRTARLLRVLSGSSASCPSHQLSRPTLSAGSSDGRQRGGPGGAEVTQRGPARCIARCWCDLHFVRSRDRRSDDSGPWSFAIPHRAGLTGVRRTQPVPGCSRFRPHRGAPGCLNCPGVRMAVREG